MAATRARGAARGADVRPARALHRGLRAAHYGGTSESTDAIMLGTMPPRVRELYELRFGLPQQAAFNAAATMRAGRRLMPNR